MIVKEKFSKTFFSYQRSFFFTADAENIDVDKKLAGRPDFEAGRQKCRISDFEQSDQCISDDLYYASAGSL